MTVGVCVTLPLCACDADAPTLNACVGVGSCDPVGVCVALEVAPWLGVLDDVDVTEGVPDAEGVSTWERLDVNDGVTESVPDGVDPCVMELVTAWLPESVPESVGDCEFDPVGAWLPDGVDKAVATCDGDCVPELVRVAICVCVCVAVQLIVGVAVKTTDVVTVGDCVCDTLAAWEEEGVGIWLELIDNVCEGVEAVDGVPVAVGVGACEPVAA